MSSLSRFNKKILLLIFFSKFVSWNLKYMKALKNTMNYYKMIGF